MRCPLPRGVKAIDPDDKDAPARLEAWSSEDTDEEQEG